MGTKLNTLRGRTLLSASDARTEVISVSLSKESSYSQLTAENFLFAVLI